MYSGVTEEHDSVLIGWLVMKWSSLIYQSLKMKMLLLFETMRVLTFRHRASCILGQAFHYSPENAFYIFNQQIYFII